MSDELCRKVDGRAFWPQTVFASAQGQPRGRQRPISPKPRETMSKQGLEELRLLQRFGRVCSAHSACCRPSCARWLTISSNDQSVPGVLQEPALQLKLGARILPKVLESRPSVLRQPWNDVSGFCAGSAVPERLGCRRLGACS